MNSKEITKAKKFIFNVYGFYYNKIKILKINDILILFTVNEILYLHNKDKKKILTINY